MQQPKGPEDIRVETAGQWTRGMHVVDRRNRRKAGPTEQVRSPGAIDILNPMEGVTIVTDVDDDIPGDDMGWLNPKKGNRVDRIVGTPGEDAFGDYLLHRIFG